MRFVSIDEVEAKLHNKETFVLNIIAEWCPDCTQRQRPLLADFAMSLHEKGLDLVQVVVQSDVPRVFISEEAKSLARKFGGPGFPRTALVVEGKIVDANNVEVVTEAGLAELVVKFAQKVS